MGDIHALIARHGRDTAKQLVGKDRSLVDLAAAVMEDETQGVGITYSGFCLTSLPHKKLPDDQRWVREHGKVSLVIDPGIARQHGGAIVPVGVPYGARARLILIYLQTEALRNRSRQIELGRSMHAWLRRMDIEAGGSTYKAVQEQASRLSACRLTFFWTDSARGTQGFAKENIVSSGIEIAPGDSRQGQLWEPVVELSEGFYRSLTKHPVPVLESAVKCLSTSSMALDVYVWLAYRLHVLSQPLPLTWANLYSQFGQGYATLATFKFRFKEVLDMALAVYPDAVVSRDDGGIVLHPSPSPIPEKALLAG